MLLRMEDTRAVSGWLGGQEMLSGEILSPEEVVERLEAVTPDDLTRVRQRPAARRPAQPGGRGAAPLRAALPALSTSKSVRSGRRAMPVKKRKALVIVYTGNGKGKTTAALGMLLRAWGRGMKVCHALLHQERDLQLRRGARRAKLGIELIPLGGGFTWLSKDLEKDKALAQQLLGAVQGEDRLRRLRHRRPGRDHLPDQLRLARPRRGASRRCATARPTCTSSSPAATRRRS